MVNEESFQSKNVGDLPVWVEFKGRILFKKKNIYKTCIMYHVVVRKKENKKKEHLCEVPT